MTDEQLEELQEKIDYLKNVKNKLNECFAVINRIENYPYTTIITAGPQGKVFINPSTEIAIKIAKILREYANKLRDEYDKA